jgi:prepilin-type N-terminal cleavage/methylation domain-containing protein
MNIQQMKSAIAKFRKADMTMIKDEKLRAKGKMLQAKEKGFTLLELLVVITLLAILATGALVAYDGAGEKAQASKAANTIAVLDQGVRAYRAVSQAYPNQWDNLSDPLSTAPIPNLPEDLSRILGSLDVNTAFQNAYGLADEAATQDFLEDYFEDNFGMDEVQHVFGTGNGLNGPVEPNRAHNEGTNPPDGSGNGAVETEYSDFVQTGALGTGDPQYLSILASDAFDNVVDDGVTTINCNVAGTQIDTAWDGDPAEPLIINSINDALSTERCNLVLALGFGGDAAQSTVNSSAGVIQAPTYSSAEVNPAENYSRYIGLFLLATGEKVDDSPDAATAANLTQNEFLPRPRLLGFIDTEGNTIDANIATATLD